MPSLSADRILVVLPYGMSFRNVVMNDDLWSQLTTRYEVDVLTPLDIENPGARGIRRVVPYPEGTISHLLPRRLLQAEFYLRWLPFYLHLGLRAELKIIYHRWLRGPGMRRLFTALGRFGATRVGRWLSRLLQTVRFQDSFTNRLVRGGGYSAVLCTHTHELVNVLVSRAARIARVPVACMAFGFDNLINHGPMLMQPDLLLVWGPQQREEFLRFQCGFDPRLAAIQVDVVGNPTYDAYRSRPPTPRPQFLESLGLNENVRLLLLTVTVDWFVPGQAEVATAIVRGIQRAAVGAILLIRARPGFDADLWATFAARFPEHVRLQLPTGSSFLTSPSDGTVKWEEEVQSLQEFIDVMAHSELVITSSPSTIWLDALLFDRPTVTVAYNKKLDATPTPLRTWLECEINRPFLEDYVLAESPERLEALVAEHLSGARPLRPARTDLLRQIAGVNEVSAGQRAATAIARLIGHQV